MEEVDGGGGFGELDEEKRGLLGEEEECEEAVVRDRAREGKEDVDALGDREIGC